MRGLATILVGFVVASTVFCGAAMAQTVSYAIVVGTNEPPRGEAGAGLRRLKYADDDAVRYFRFFSSFAARTWLLSVLDRETQGRHPDIAQHSSPPTAANLKQAVQHLAKQVQRDHQAGKHPVFYFVFSGHGARSSDGSSFLVLPDAALTRDVLYNEILSKVPDATTHVIVDACYADAVVGTRKLFGNEVDAQSVRVAPKDAVELIKRTTLRRFPNVGAIVATTANQEAHEWSKIQSGVFTHEVLSGLHGAADVNSDGKIEYSELQAFIAAANRQIKNSMAKPRVISYPPLRNLREPLFAVKWLKRGRWLTGNFSRLGHFYIELDNGQRHLDAHLRTSYSSTLIVPGETKIFVRTRDRESEIGPGQRGPIKLASLTFSKSQVSQRGSVEAAYRTALFAAPFGPTYYRGFLDSTGDVGVSFPTIQHNRAASAPPSGEKNYLGWSLVGLGAASFAASLTTGILSLKAKSDFDSTTKQKPAHEANDRYVGFGIASIATGALAVASGLAAWWLWPKKDPRVTVSAGFSGTQQVALRLTW